MNKDLVTISSLSEAEVRELLTLTGKLKKSPFLMGEPLKQRTLALLFQKPSNRTRISFEVAMTHLGGYTLYLSPGEIDMGRREPPKDVAQVLSRYVDCIVARVYAHDDIITLAANSSVPVINGLSDRAHPCQALSDIFTVLEKFGTFKGIKLAYVGDGNNVLNSLMIACAKVGLDIVTATPRGYEPTAEIVAEGIDIAAKTGSSVKVMKDPFEAVRGADIVYTDVWVSMGQEDERDKRLKDFRDYQINEKLMKNTGKKTLLMHCLPAHRGEEVTDVIDGPNSIIYDQAENRMHMQKAILYTLLAAKR